MRETRAWLARLAQRVARRLWAGRLPGGRAADGETAQRDPLAAYAAPPRRSQEPPYASLRQ